MMNLRSRIYIIISHFCAVIILSECLNSKVVVVLADGTGNEGVENGDSQFCSINLATFLPPPYGNLSYSSCRPVWNTFVLRYYQTEDRTVTIVLSALYTTGWVGIGFSKDGMMVGGSAMVGWVSKTGHARMKQYHLRGRTSSEVVPNKGDLNLTSIPPIVVLDGANIYLAFQVRFNASMEMQPTLLAYGSRYPVNHKLAMHDDKTTLRIDYSTTKLSDSDASATGDFDNMKRSHGILGIIGWGLILPCGAMVARFLKRKEPLWYYLHTIIQLTGFLIAVSGVVVGQALYNRMHPNVAAHRGIGYFALTLSILQVLAFFMRPDKETKARRLWAAYHRWFGVITLFFGALNIVLGIQVGGAGIQWKLGYGFLVGTIIVTATILQVLTMLKTEKHTDSSTFQMS